MGNRVFHGTDETGTIGTVRVEGGSAATPRHTHESLILGRVDCGTRTLHLDAGDVSLGPGDGFAIPPDTPHAWAAAQEGRHRVLVLPPRFVHAPAWSAGLIRESAWNQVFDAVFACIEEGRTPAPGLMEALSKQTGALAGTARRASLAPGPVHAARREAVGRLEERLVLAELARRVGLSPSHLHRLYRRTWGMTPAEHRLEARLRQARGLILQGAAMADVAAATGFADQSHFTRAFRRLMGVSPGAWARQMRPRENRKPAFARRSLTLDTT
ncbi:transcriptional regulator [Pararhodospirillum oryzae]|uniref:Transcriptional regulator n=2 Tax=Pararhodospirillum oryzae TaxID=478448 RepID=A0A512H5S0_9PROT|nr:transcriptional regulator [Pararhodospirillum oryzae]